MLKKISLFTMLFFLITSSGFLGGINYAVQDKILLKDDKNNSFRTSEAKEITPEKALMILKEGNNRFANGRSNHPNQNAERRKKLKTGQYPFAAIISCSDSRVPLEIIFDQGIGDLFIIRDAGNIIDDMALGGIEYAIKYLESKIIIVLGHDKCGAVAATLKGGKVPGHIAKIVEQIQPAVDKAKKLSGDTLANAIKENVLLNVTKVETSEPIIKEFVHKNKIKVVGGIYCFDTGKVDFLK
ncbi:MAG: carbonic anhydrase [Desulfobacterales bacterium]|nr:carbonic anhydrase [Desulfobacterales bacterium]MBF0395964.1 carbonic anhydrase [Desulfobacterales bacterium]